MRIEVAHRSYWQTADVVFGVPFAIAVVLQFAVPVSLPRGVESPAFTFGGAALIIVGVAFVVLARRELARRGQPTDPGLPTGKIVTTGVFSISRNPLYLGAVCFFFGLALTLLLPWVLILLLPSLVACHYVLIAPEERYLLGKFGEEYRLYASTVHRWIGRARIPR